MSGERAFATIRREQGYTAEWAATLLRISPQHLRRLERGIVPLSLPLAQRMAWLYKSDLNRLTEPPAGSLQAILEAGR